MEKVRPWCGQPSDRGRLRNRNIPTKWRSYRDHRFCDVISSYVLEERERQRDLEVGERLEAERDDGQQDDGDRHDGDHARRHRALRVLEQQPHLHTAALTVPDTGKRRGWRTAAAGSGSGDDAISRSTPLSQAVVLADQQLSADRLARGQHRRVSLHARAACRLYYARCAVNQPLHIHLPGEYLALAGGVA